MQVFSQDFLARLTEIPLPLVVALLAMGPIFWILGWRIHRVLFVASASFIAGLYGLVHGPKLLFGLNEYLAGLLLAVGVGGVAIALLRIGVFVVCGLLADAIAIKVAPEYFDPGLVGPVRGFAFLAGGLLSIVFYRLMVILTTAALGAGMIVGAVISLTHQTSAYDAMKGGSDLQVVVAGALVALIAVGTGAQYLLAVRFPPEREPAEDADKDESAEGAPA